MSTYEQAVAKTAAAPERRKPGRIIVLPPSAFSDEWPQKPLVDVAVGLRLVSEGTIQTAKVEAERLARGFYEGREVECLNDDSRNEAYRDALVRFVCARAMTNPNDVNEPYFQMAEDTIACAMTTGGIMRVWDEYIVHLLGSGNRTAPITEEGVEELAAALRPEVVSALPMPTRLEVQKLLSHLHEIITPAAAVADAASGYVLHAHD